MKKIKVKPNEEGKIIIKLFGQEYEIEIEKESKKAKKEVKEEEINEMDNN